MRASAVAQRLRFSTRRVHSPPQFRPTGKHVPAYPACAVIRPSSRRALRCQNMRCSGAFQGRPVAASAGESSYDTFQMSF